MVSIMNAALSCALARLALRCAICCLNVSSLRCAIPNDLKAARVEMTILAGSSRTLDRPESKPGESILGVDGVDPEIDVWGELGARLGADA